MAIINGAGLAHASGAGHPGSHAGPDGVLLPSRAASQKLIWWWIRSVLTLKLRTHAMKVYSPVADLTKKQFLNCATARYKPPPRVKVV